MDKKEQVSRKGLFYRIYRSVFPGTFQPKTDTERRRAILNSLILHIHPPVIEKSTLRFSRTWGLGGMALLLVMIQFISGVFLKFVYLPFPGKAYESIITLQNEIMFGQLIRNIHYWSAVLLLLVTFLHLLRVYFTGAFTNPRQFNWVIGLGLFFLVIFSNFTGYLLPWDQLAYWAITICIGIVGYIPWVGPWLQDMIRGGSEVGPVTISIFYTFHTFILPASLVFLMGFHFWRVRKAGGIMKPPDIETDSESKPGMVSTIPHLVVREGVVALVLIGLILFLAIFFNAPLAEKANPGLSPNPTKAPWYFMGFQELLMHFHPLFAVLIIPLLFIVIVFLIPYIRYDQTPQGLWFHSTKGRKMSLVAALIALILTPAVIVLDEFVINVEFWLPGIPTLLTLGLVPVLVFMTFLILFYKWMKRRYDSSNNEVLQALFILLLVAFLITTIVGIWFRGEGMALVWPWK
jgi:quinol-cytochrome oxidoreductase complex cytochrome b subunit